MQYMLMCCIDEALWNGLPDAERDAVMSDYHALIQEMVTSGHYRGGARLQSVASATTLREQNGKTVMLDGPFAESRAGQGQDSRCRDPVRDARRHGPGRAPGSSADGIYLIFNEGYVYNFGDNWVRTDLCRAARASRLLKDFFEARDESGEAASGSLDDG